MRATTEFSSSGMTGFLRLARQIVRFQRFLHFENYYFSCFKLERQRTIEAAISQFLYQRLNSCFNLLHAIHTWPLAGAGGLLHPLPALRGSPNWGGLPVPYRVAGRQGQDVARSVSPRQPPQRQLLLLLAEHREGSPLRSISSTVSRRISTLRPIRVATTLPREMCRLRVNGEIESILADVATSMSPGSIRCLSIFLLDNSVEAF